MMAGQRETSESQGEERVNRGESEEGIIVRSDWAYGNVCRFMIQLWQAGGVIVLAWKRVKPVCFRRLERSLSWFDPSKFKNKGRPNVKIKAQVVTVVISQHTSRPQKCKHLESTVIVVCRKGHKPFWKCSKVNSEQPTNWCYTCFINPINYAVSKLWGETSWFNCTGEDLLHLSDSSALFLYKGTGGMCNLSLQQPLSQ